MSLNKKISSLSFLEAEIRKLQFGTAATFGSIFWHNLIFATLNINGINDNLKLIKLVEYIWHNGIQSAAIQEHNIKLLS